MKVFKMCKRTMTLPRCIIVFLSVIIVTSQAMTISREDLSQLFNGFLDNLDQRTDEIANQVDEKVRQVEPDGVNDEVNNTTTQMEPDLIQEMGEEDPAEISQKLKSILRELHHVESGIEDTEMTPQTMLEEAETADAMLIELLNESRRMAAHSTDNGENDSDDDDDDNNHSVHAMDIAQKEVVQGVSGDNNDADEGHSITNSTSDSSTAMSDHPDTDNMPRDNGNVPHPYDFAVCELRLNEGLAPLTLAKYHGFKGTVNLRQNRSNGSRDVLIRLYGLGPWRSNHGVFIREFGDLSNGCQRLGPIFDTYGNDDQANGISGELAVVTSSDDDSGFVEYRSTEVDHFDLTGQNSIYGRSIVIEEDSNTFSAPLGCCVIGVTRDAGEWM